jgi:hypothetical protein
MQAYITPKVKGITPDTILKLCAKLDAIIESADGQKKVAATKHLDLDGKRYHGTAAVDTNVQWDITSVEALPGTTTKADKAAPRKAAAKKAAAKKAAPKKSAGKK